MSHRSSRGRIVSVDLESSTAEPLHRRIYQSLRRDIVAGVLLPGATLPSTRSLAGDLGISRGTAVLAYEQLRQEGYLIAERGGGTRVAARLPELCLRATTTPMPLPRTIHARAISRRGEALTALWRDTPIKLTNSPPRAFRAMPPALDVFPVDLWARIAARQWRRATTRDLAYGSPLGHVPLRQAIAEHLRVTRGVCCSPDQVVVVAGTQQGLDLCARVLLDAGDQAWLEDPGYPAARGALVASGAEVVPVRVDHHGLDVADGQRRAPHARLAFVTPSHQMPLGVLLSGERRSQLLDWAAGAEAWIFEDDYNSDFHYASQPTAALYALDRAERVIYAGTFNKSLFPALRLGFLVVPPSLVEPFSAARHFADIMPPWLTQAVLTEFLADGHYHRHLRRLRAIYQSRRAVLVDGLARHCSRWLEPQPLDSGRELVAWVAGSLDDVHIADVAARAGIDVMPLSTWAQSHSLRPALRLGYSGIDEADIESGVRRLAEVLDTVAKRSRTVA